MFRSSLKIKVKISHTIMHLENTKTKNKNFTRFL